MQIYHEDYFLLLSNVCFANVLSGLSKLTSDPRSAIRKSSLEVLFNILKDHGHLFSRTFWAGVFSLVIYPIFNFVNDKGEKDTNNDQFLQDSKPPNPDVSTWDSETCTVAAQCLVDLFVSFFNVVRSQLLAVVTILTGFITSSSQAPSSTGVTALVQLADDLGDRLSEDEWKTIFTALKEVTVSTLPRFSKVISIMDDIGMPEASQASPDFETLSDNGLTNDDIGDDTLQTAAYVVSRMKSHIAMQLLIIQVLSPIFRFLSFGMESKIFLWKMSCCRHVHSCELYFQILLSTVILCFH